jgi:hypothetical protein
MLFSRCSEHERQRVLQVGLEGRQPPCTKRPIDRTVITAHGDLHDVHSLETTFVLDRWNKGRLSRPNSKDARLRWIYDGRKMRDIEHAEVRDRERASLSRRLVEMFYLV